MNALLTFFHPKPKSWTGCRPLTAAERMARYSQRHAELIRQRENEGAGMAHAQLRGGEMVLVTSMTPTNRLPNQLPDESRADYETRMDRLRQRRITFIPTKDKIL